MHPMLIIACVGGVIVLLAWGLWSLVRRWDRENAILAAAPALPIRLLDVHDDAWIRGIVRCERPLTVPHFRFIVVHFTYLLEERVMRTRVDSKGRVTTEYVWETRDRKQGTAPFAIEDEGLLLPVDAFMARYADLPTRSNTIGSWRHTTHFLPANAEVSVVGVVEEVEGQRLFTRVGHVPLIVTPRTRAAYIASGESWERNVYRVGLFLLTAGFLLTFYGMGRFLQAPEPFFDMERQWWHPGLAIFAAVLTVVFAASAWSMRTYNNLVTFRIRADEFWSSLDVNLKQRFDVVPNLVAVVRGYSQYETEAFESVARLRSEALAGSREQRVACEGRVVAGVQKLLALREAYPQLQANERFMKLSDQLVALEDKIAHARSVYNDAVAEYNREVRQFPSNFVARWTGFQAYPLFAAELVEKAAPRVDLQAADAPVQQLDPAPG